MANNQDANLPQVDEALERQKALGQTDSQQAIRDYNAGDFQTTDPVTGEPRELPGASAAKADADDGIDATPAARELAKAEGVDLNDVKGTGADGRITVEDVRNYNRV